MLFHLPSFANKPIELTFLQLGINPADYNGISFEKIRPEYINRAADYMCDITGDYDYEIEFDEFEIGDTASSIENAANIYSCCGDILDKDYMICPSCKEHC
jgi:hypothetical protein